LLFLKNNFLNMSTKTAATTYSSVMSKGLFILLMLICACIIACESEDILETDAELIPYFQIFADEGEKRGFTVDYEAARIEGLIQDISSPTVQGQCFYNEEKPRKVIIDVNYWNNADFSEKEFIIFHELGHCFLDRGHLDGSNGNGVCLSIMHSSPQACNFRLTDANREAYLDELFLQ